MVQIAVIRSVLLLGQSILSDIILDTAIPDKIWLYLLTYDEAIQCIQHCKKMFANAVNIDTKLELQSH